MGVGKYSQVYQKFRKEKNEIFGVPPFNFGPQLDLS